MRACAWVDAFLDALTADRDAARNTRLAYERDLRHFCQWLALQGTEPGQAAADDIDRYLQSCEAEGLAKPTRARRLSAIRQFYRFVHEEGWRDDNPALRLSGPGREGRLPGTLELAEIEALLAAARSAPRDRVRATCLLELLYATGLRVTELVGLPVSAVRGDPRMILVRGKGGRERLVPLSPPARVALQHWLAERDAAEAAKPAGRRPSPFLFPSRAVGGHLTRQGFFNLLKELAAAAGLPADRVAPHRVRHAFATHLLAGGADLRAIQSLLGHADVATTEIYTHVLADRLKELVMVKHPLADPPETKDDPAP